MIYDFRVSASGIAVPRCGMSLAPLPVCDIAKFENANADISVNVCVYEDGKLIPLYVTPHRHRNLHVNLLLLKNHHYVLIRQTPFTTRGSKKQT